MKIPFTVVCAFAISVAAAQPYRFVAFNVWGNYFGNPPEGRAEIQHEILSARSPDFLGLQEMTADFWASKLITGLTNSYETVGRGLGPDGADAHVPVLYRRDRFQLLESGAKWFCPELDKSKGVVWAALKDRTSGSNIVVFATHFWWRYDGKGDDYIRLDNARQLFAVVSAAAKRHDAAVVGGGDFNAGGASAALRELSRLGWRDAQLTTPGRDSRMTWHGEPKRNSRTGKFEGVTAERSVRRGRTLDHIFYSPARVRAREFRVETGKKTISFSDHSPIVFDFGIHAEVAGWKDPRKTMSLEPMPRSTDPKDWLSVRFARKLAEAKGDRDVVFIGDSITHYWETNGKQQWERYFDNPSMRSLNLGFSGDRTEHILWRIEHGMIDGFKAKAVVLMIGTNNTGHFPADKTPPIDVIVGVRAVVEAIRERQPDARIILHPILPRGESPDDPYRLRNDVVNAEIAKLADARNVIWCDFSDLLLRPDGTLPREIMPDFLHPSAIGYEIWANAVLPILGEILRTDPGATIGGRYARSPAPVRDLALPVAYRPVSRFDTGGTRGKWWWANRLMEKRNEIAASDGEFDIVMVGDSITHFWEDFNYWTGGLDSYDSLCAKYRVLNLGYGGDRTQNVLWRLENGELDGYKAKTFMLMIGTNNGGDSPEDTAEGIRRILALIARRHPESRTLLVPIFPRGVSGDRQRERIGKINAIIKQHADGKKVIWFEFAAEFLKPDGNFKPGLFIEDNLHPRFGGYEIWRKALEEKCRQLAK